MKISNLSGFLVATALITISGCTLTVADAYNTAKTANDVTFKAAMIRVCSPVADLPAIRQLSPVGVKARTLMCADWVTVPSE